MTEPSAVVASVLTTATMKCGSSSSHVSVKWTLFPVQAVLFLRL